MSTAMEPGPVRAPLTGDLLSPEELMSVGEFARSYPNIVTSEAALRWLLGAREDNGLLEFGAVIEIRRRRGQSRARLLISPSRFVAWAQARFGRGR